jgi:Ankyrin repeat
MLIHCGVLLFVLCLSIEVNPRLYGFSLLCAVCQAEESALHIAAENGHAAVCELLINRGADIDAEDEVKALTLRVYIA